MATAAVYLKNRGTLAWNPADDYPQAKRIPDNERAKFRQRLVPLLAPADPRVRSQLVTILQAILHKDFPGAWPQFFDITVQLLQAQDVASVSAGLQCIVGICRVYRFRATDERADFEKIVSITFPQILAIGNRLAEETSDDAGEMLRAIMKAAKHTIYFELPQYMREEQATIQWLSLFLKVVALEHPPMAQTLDADDRELSHWWKAKKWAYSNLNRLFVRYGNPGTMSKSNSEMYANYSEVFLQKYAPEILKVYLQQIENWAGQSTWLSKAALSQIISYLDECVRPKVTWALLRPHIESLISHFIFPVLCQSDEDLELFDEDPSEYLQRKLNFYEQISAPDVQRSVSLIR